MLLNIKLLLITTICMLPGAVTATGEKSPHRKHSKSPHRDKKTKQRTPQDQALHDAKKAMKKAAKELETAEENLRQAQQEQNRAENRAARVEEQLRKTINQMAKESERILETHSAEDSIALKTASQNMVQKNKKIFDLSRTNKEALNAANKAVTDAQAAVDRAQANYNGAKAYYEQLAAQVEPTKK